MTEAWIEDAEVNDPFGEAERGWESFGSDFESFEPESEDGESFASARRLRARRELELDRQRRRAAMARSGRVQSPAGRRAAAPVAARTTAAIHQLDVQSRMQADSIRRALDAQQRRSSRAEYAAAGSVVATVAQSAFSDVFDSGFARAAVTVAPLMILSPVRKGTGVTSFLYDPRVIGTAAAFGLAYYSERRGRISAVHRIAVSAPPNLLQGQRLAIVADLFDRRGGVMASRTPVWHSSVPGVATVDDQGEVTAHGPGYTNITATADGAVDHVWLQVIDTSTGDPRKQPARA